MTMTRKNSWVPLAFTTLLTLPLDACKYTKTLQENEQLKAKVAELQKDNGQVGNDLDAMTSSRDDLAKQNEVLKSQLNACKGKHSSKKSASHKHHR
jgi:septal ring factor EnvC (AmiA/AmiB activator)